MRVFSHFILRWAGIVSLIGTLLAVAGGYYSVQLYKNLRTNFEELLPTDARSVKDLNEVQNRLQAIDNLGILILSKDGKASKKFVLDLVTRLNKLPKDIASSVEYQISKELDFFKRRQALYMDVEDLIKIRDYVDEKIRYEKELYNPLNLFRTEEIMEPKLDYQAIRRRYAQAASAYDRYPEGFYATPDETKRVVLVYLSGEASSIEKGLALKHAVEKQIAELNPKSYAPDIEIRYTGGVQDSIEEHDALIEDLELSTIIVMILVTIAMLAFFRAFRATTALVVSLLMGTLWTFGASYYAVGYLNANSAFLGSIVLGNGINFGIILLARYIEERRRGCHNPRAIRIAIATTATSTWTAALAAGLSYGSLILTGFRGFKQFGIIGLIGMVLCWLSAFILLPAYLTVLDRFSPLIKKGKREPKPILTEGLARMIDRAPGIIWALSIVATIASFAALTRYHTGILETDLSQLRNKNSLQSGSAYYSKYLDEIFQRYLSPLVILPPTHDQALKIAALLKEKKAQQGKDSLIASVQTLDDFVPKKQAEKIAVLREIQKLLPPKIFNRLSQQDQEHAREFLTPEAFHPIGYKDLPPLLLNKFTEKDGTIGKLVLVEPPLTNELSNGDKLVSFIRDLRQAADQIAPGAAVAGSLTITSDMIEAISVDGPKATFFAFMAVVLLVIVLFRNIPTITLILFSLFLGVLWLAGLILGFWIKINFLNFIALPITFGIGIDYGVNMFQRYRLEGGGNILRVIRNTGGAVGLCSLSTMIGYSSLLIASNKAFVSFGWLAVLGEITCVVAALISLPAYLLWKHRRLNPAAQAVAGVR